MAQYSLVDVGYGVHPAAHPHLVAHVGGVAELVDDADVVGVGPTEDLLLQSQCIHLGTKLCEHHRHQDGVAESRAGRY